MPPKKKKPTPLVVGTVSTRSTQRESIVNIKIIPKANRSSKSSVRKRETKKDIKAAYSNNEIEKGSLELTPGLEERDEETRPEILEILKDWSDDENCEGDNRPPVQPTNSSSSLRLASDKQSLIDILEGKQFEVQDELFLQKTSNNTPTPLLRTCIGNDTFIENPDLKIDSPKIEEPEIIEECVVEDDSFIIELPGEHFENSISTEENLSADVAVSSGHGSPRPTPAAIKVCNALKNWNIPSQNLKTTHKNNKDVTSLKSEDNSQGTLIIQDKHLLDNASKNYAILERQVLYDKSEPIIGEDFNNTAKSSRQSRSNHNRYIKMAIESKTKIVVGGAETLSNSVMSMLPADETSLCEKVSESLHISQGVIKNLQRDPRRYHTSEKLQDCISKLSIKTDDEIYAECQMENYKNFTTPPTINKSIEKLSESNYDVAYKMASKALPKKTQCKTESDTDNKMNRRRSTRRKTNELDLPTKCVNKDSDVAVDQLITAENSGSSSGSSNLEDRNVHIKANIESSTIYTVPDISKLALDSGSSANKEDTRESKISKAKLKRLQQKQIVAADKMDIDSESSETKTSEGDSTSNESSQDQTSNKFASKTCKAKSKLSANLIFGNQQVSHSKVSDSDTNSCTIDITANRKSPKVTKPKSKRCSMKDVDESTSKMDIVCLAGPQDSVNILRSAIDVTIDEVLQKYTYDVPELGSHQDVDLEADILRDNKTKFTKDPKKKKDKSKKDEKNGDSSEEVRRSDRIKTILPVKKKSHGLVRSKSEPVILADAENSDSNSAHNDFDKPFQSPSPQLSKSEKTKSRSKSSENLQSINLPPSNSSPDLPRLSDIKADKSGQTEIEARFKTFIHLKENQYKTDRQVCKEAREMICDCYLAEEDIQKDEYGCGEDCLNRLLMIECGELCQVGGRCTNKRFQKNLFAPVEVFKTEKKGLGLRAAANIAYGEFILEYIGEVLNPDEFDKRAEVYSKDQNIHFYFMSLRADAIIDATMKGNISRFINHSCDPNAETQKWTVNGEVRIGFFSTRTILAGEEITFDYRFQRYGKEAQKCYCEASICRGWLGERPEESEDEEEEEEEESTKVLATPTKAEVEVSPEIPKEEGVGEIAWPQETLLPEQINVDEILAVSEGVAVNKEPAVALGVQETPKKTVKKKARKELLYDDFDQLNEDIEMLVTTGLKNQAHTLKLSRLMVRAKDLDQRKKLLRVLRRGELPCRRLFLDYHGLRLMHGYMIDAQQLASGDGKVVASRLEVIQTKLELVQTLAVLPIQNKTMLIESKVLPAVEKWAKNEDIIEDSDQKDIKKSPEDAMDTTDPEANEKIDEIKFLATKLLEEWTNLKESFRIPKKQRIEQMKEHEKEANRKFMESSYAQEKESSRKHDQRHRTWSRYKSERESSRKSSRGDDKDRPSAEFLKISKHERRKLFALQMELREEERRLKQREMWRQHEMNCMMIGADPRFTAPFDPNKGFQYIWNPSLGQWQALPVPAAQNQASYNSPATSQGASGFNVPPHKQPLLGPYQNPMMNVPGISGAATAYSGLQSMVPGLTTSVSAMGNPVPGMTVSLPGVSSNVPGMSGPVHGLPASMAGIAGSLPGINHPPLPTLPVYQDVKQEDPSQVRFAGPIPPPAKLPPKWKCAKDKYGRPYYYHVKLRKSQWEPPPLPEPLEELSDSSSSETSSGSSSDSSSESESDDEIDDAKLLFEVRKQMENTPKISLKSIIPDYVKKEEIDSATPSPDIKMESDNEDDSNMFMREEIQPEHLSSIDIRLKEQFNFDNNDPPRKKKRTGLCQEIIISPRTEEDRKQFKEDVRRYKATKEKLKRQKEQMLQQAKKKLKISSGEETKRSKDKRSSKSTGKTRTRDRKEWNDEHAKKIKELFRSTMATTVVGVLNAYRKPDCKEARITNTEDFKHLARKLTHFVMLKEIKHLSSIDELVCSDNVKAKAREYIRKYMSKFGEVYQKRQDEPDFKD